MHFERDVWAKRLVTTGAMALAALLSACGGGGGGGPVPIGAIDGGGARIFAAGPVNGFGSVIVNGVRYDTSQATIIVNGQVASEQDLKVGQIVRVSATDDGSQIMADRVEFDENVEGPIASIDTAAGTMVVLGQTVVINAGTSFDDDISPQSLDGLVAGDIVEVSGYVDADGQVIATRVELQGAGGEFEVTGLVSNLDGGAMTFQINALTIDYSQATLEDFNGGQIANGDVVEAKGTQFDGNGALLATRVEQKNNLFDDDVGDADVEIEGLVTRFASTSDFDVAGIPVATTGSTVYEDGTAANLALNVLVEVHGNFDANGVLVADRIDFEEDGALRIDALVDAVDAAASTVTMLGITVQIDASTRMEDNSDLELRPFTVADIAVGDWLEIRGIETSAGSNVIAASQLERDDAEDEASIRGIASDVSDPSFRILGLDIDTDGGTEFENTTRAGFFSGADGRLVEADGNLNGSRFLATSVEFEN